MIRIFNHYVRTLTLLRILLDVALVFLVIAGGVMLQANALTQDVLKSSPHAMSLAAGLFVINSASGFYREGYNRSIGQSFARALFALLLALPLTYAIFSLMPAQLSNRDVVLWSAMTGVAAVILRRVYVSHLAAEPRARSRVLIYGCGEAAAAVGNALKDSDPNVHIVGYVPGPNEKCPAVAASELLGSDVALNETARKLGVDEIVVALTERRAGSMPLRELLDCKLFGIKVYDISTHFEKTLGIIRIDYLNAGWLIFGDGFNQGAYRTMIKRAFDIVCALVLFVVSAPVMLLASLLIKLEGRGPVLYLQERVGLNGRPFKVAKFRSMRLDAEGDGQPRWASTNDDRVTRVGKIIRRLRIDELPQLFNVLKGEMSLVGPRPERPYFVDQLTQDIPYFAVRHSVKPGLTGWAQVRYQYGATIEDAQQKLQYDLYYVKNHSLFLDLVILLETVGVVLTGKGAR
jgi:sugar transferase (PEP-CTERM system associated)